MRKKGWHCVFSKRAEPSPASLVVSVFAILVSCLLPAGPATADGHKVWVSDPYSFSDELGGFRITGVSGKGTRDDPIVLEEELDSATPVTLTIRTTKPICLYGSTGECPNGITYMRLHVLNGSGQPWIEFEFELQEILNQPSTFGDGLSFDQRDKSSSNIASPNFAKFDRDFEPYDKLLFTQGKVDPLKSGQFEFLVTDFTPRWIFYLVQDPRIPAS